jgi:hypothetical protein
MDNVIELAASLKKADPEETATLWLEIAGDHDLAVKVHQELGEQGRLVLAEKLDLAARKVK